MVVVRPLTVKCLNLCVVRLSVCCLSFFTIITFRENVRDVDLFD